MLKSIFSKFFNKQVINKRDSRLVISVLTSVFAKVISIGATLVTFPLTLEYLGAEEFGVWLVISSVVGFIVFSDLGVGMGLQNALSKSYGKNDKNMPKHHIANAYISVSAISLTLIFLTVFTFHHLPTEKIFKSTDSKLLESATVSLKFALILFFIGMPISLVQRVLNGIQKTYLANFVLLLGSIASLISILISVYFELGLPLLVSLFIASPIFAQLMYSIFFFYCRPNLRPSIKNCAKEYFRDIVSAGLWTVFAQLVYAAKTNAPIVIISATLGLVSVAEFSVVQKLIALVSTMIGMALQPLWVVYGEAYFSNDKAWIKKSLKRSIIAVLGLTILAAMFFQLFGQLLIELWIGNEILPSRPLIGLFSLWMIVSTTNIAFTMLMNGTGHFKFQSLISFIFLIIAVFLLFYTTPRFGINSSVLVMLVITELCILPFYFLECKKIIRKIKEVA